MCLSDTHKLAVNFRFLNYFRNMSKLPFLLLAGILSLLTSALRVQASCMGMGQAAGVTAALAAEKRRDPRDIPIDLIKKQLTDIGHIVPLQ